MEVSFTGTVEEWRSLFPTSDQSQVLTAIADLKGLVQMQGAELQKLNELTNTLATTVEEVVAQDAAEDKAFQDTIDDLKAQLDAATAAGQIQKDLADSLKAQLDEETAGIGDVNPRLQAVIDALKATGASPSNPLPTPDIPPAPTDEPPPA